VERPLRTIYISYFGATKHLCQTQVLPYLKELAREGIDVTLLSFEEPLEDREHEQREIARLRGELVAAGIDWHPLRYHKRPSLPAKIYDVVIGTIYAAHLARKKGIHVVHARNHIPAVMALALQAVLPIKLLFDMRGVMAEEYVDAGLWKQGGLPYRLTKWVESTVFRRADAIVMLTHRIERVLRASSPDLGATAAPIEIIPCCVELDRYRGLDRAAVRRRLGLANQTVMVYSGSLGGWYLTQEMADLFAAGRALIDRLHFLVLTQSPKGIIAEALQRRGIPERCYTILTVPPDAMPEHLAAADFGISLIRPCYSKLSSCPTKIGEYLASGLPILSSAGIGDIDELVQQEGVGVLIERFDAPSYRRALEEMRTLLGNGPAIQSRCRGAAEHYFSMDRVGREGYLRVYRHLGWRDGKDPA